VSIERIAHIGIAVHHWEEQLSFYRDVLGLALLGIEEVESQKVRVAIFEVGEAHVELLFPLAPDSPIAKFLQTHGEGLHHIAYAVTDLKEHLEVLLSRGVELIDRVPRPGAGGKKIAFLHPRASFGVLTELCE
jgi:methylmalonyl-CoA/ethylmalonyl-CoA epimerase